MMEVGTIVRVLHSIRRGHLGRVIEVNFATDEVPVETARYRVRFGDGGSEIYQPAMLEAWTNHARPAQSSSPSSRAPRVEHRSTDDRSSF